MQDDALRNTMDDSVASSGPGPRCRACACDVWAVDAVSPGEPPWTEAEIAAVRSELVDSQVRLKREVDDAEAQAVGLVPDAGAGQDEGDIGSSTAELNNESPRV
jgi:hypothetical protein